MWVLGHPDPSPRRALASNGSNEQRHNGFPVRRRRYPTSANGRYDRAGRATGPKRS